jgi:hypothetical protein
MQDSGMDAGSTVWDLWLFVGMNKLQIPRVARDDNKFLSSFAVCAGALG